LENLQYIKQRGLEEAGQAKPQQEENLSGLIGQNGAEDGEQPQVARHYYNPDDERSLQGVGADQG
jgi:hypothetical protein